ncbi:TIM barrel protein [Petroclostridium sp. X23]|uniref:sugar phosphate isomerase/epimerase family protein n=1 Tax=Petroclostridium sp. X23 TaxID=3045146 RepID=UPI0024AD2742|nr:TIM barrel protein [Petroclostridium sp. X23]WHH60351.1 TIM barrel protein [Petroclostridium sp. X23]
MENIKDYMRIGIIQSMAFPSSFKDGQSLLESFKKVAADDYFDVVEIGHIKDNSIRDEIKKVIEVSKLDVSYAGHSRLLSNGLNINDLNEEGRKNALAALEEGIDEAYDMNAESFAFLSGRYDEDCKEEALQALIQSTKELCSYAQQKGGMPVLLEVFDYNIDKKSLLGPVALVERYVAEVSKEYDNFGIMVDLSHLPMLGETPRQAILPIAKHVKHVHIGNTVIKDPSMEAYGDEHPRFGFPNSENNVKEVTEFLKVLLEIGYLNKENRPILSFEIKPRPYEDSEVIIAGAKRVLRKAWSKVF